MKLKDKVLEILEINRGQMFSGAEIARQLDVSRTAVWKAVKELRADGIEINAVTNGGYTIPKHEDSLSSQGILAILGDTDFDIHTQKIVTSTNTVLKELAQDGTPAGYVLCAEEQTQGKGRLGRSFYSPADSGIYMSILLRPKINAQDSLFITTSAAVAVARAIEICSDNKVKPQIKWVNDIFIDGKKVCGILTEAAIDFESGGLEYAVLGIGVNITQPKGDFPSEIKDVATSVFDKDSKENMRNRLAAEILRQLSQMPDSFNSTAILEEYRERSMIIGKDVLAHFPNEIKPCHVIGIDERARLIIQFEDGEIQHLSSGEVSIRT